MYFRCREYVDPSDVSSLWHTAVDHDSSLQFDNTRSTKCTAAARQTVNRSTIMVDKAQTMNAAATGRWSSMHRIAMYIIAFDTSTKYVQARCRTADRRTLNLVNVLRPVSPRGHMLRVEGLMCGGMACTCCNRECAGICTRFPQLTSKIRPAYNKVQISEVSKQLLGKMMYMFTQHCHARMDESEE